MKTKIGINDEMIPGPGITPGGDKTDNNWDDEDDEAFDDLLHDRDDFHEIEMEDDFIDADDDDHLPDDDLQ